MPGVHERRKCTSQSKGYWPGGHKPPRQWPQCASPQSYISETAAGPDAGGDRRKTRVKEDIFFILLIVFFFQGEAK